MEFIASHATRAAGLPFSDAVRVGDVLCLSGQIGNRPGSLDLVPGGIEAETRQMMENIARILNASARSFDDVFKCTVMLADMAKDIQAARLLVFYRKTTTAAPVPTINWRFLFCFKSGRAISITPCTCTSGATGCLSVLAENKRLGRKQVRVRRVSQIPSMLPARIKSIFL